MHSKKLFYVIPMVILFVSNILEKSLAIPQEQEEGKTKDKTKLGPPLNPVEGNPEEANELPLELVVEIYEEGDCALKEPVKEGDTLTVHYEGHLLNTNEQFQSSWDREEPYTFTMGKGQVVQGWEIGLQGMCVGEKRVLTIPPNLGYGEEGSPPAIPPDAALKFTIVLLDKE